jgi:hypothetical protein
VFVVALPSHIPLAVVRDLSGSVQGKHCQTAQLFANSANAGWVVVGCFRGCPHRRQHCALVSAACMCINGEPYRRSAAAQDRRVPRLAVCEGARSCGYKVCVPWTSRERLHLAGAPGQRGASTMSPRLLCLCCRSVPRSCRLNSLLFWPRASIVQGACGLVVLHVRLCYVCLAC